MEFSATVLATLVSYVVWTINVTTWRTKYRVNSNKHENAAAARVFDSLVNYETVKYFNQERLVTLITLITPLDNPR